MWFILKYGWSENGVRHMQNIRQSLNSWVQYRQESQVFHQIVTNRKIKNRKKLKWKTKFTFFYLPPV